MSADPESTSLDLLPDGVVVADGEGRVVGLNTVAVAMLDLPDRDSALGAMLPDVLALSDHEGRGWVEANDPYAGLAIRTGVPEQPWLLRDGTEVLVVARFQARIAAERSTRS